MSPRTNDDTPKRAPAPAPAPLPEGKADGPAQSPSGGPPQGERTRDHVAAIRRVAAASAGRAGRADRGDAGRARAEHGGAPADDPGRAPRQHHDTDHDEHGREPASSATVPPPPRTSGTSPDTGSLPPRTNSGAPGAAPVAGNSGEAPVTAAAGAPVDEGRGRAVRRVREAGRRGRALYLAGCTLLLAVALTAGAVATGAARDGGDAVAAVPANGDPVVGVGADLDAQVASLQAHLRAQPRDHNGWARLGFAYVEQARTKADPSRYPQAEQALQRSLDLRPGNDAALAGRAALAAARHDFTGALTNADRALAENPYSERALCSRIDALVELGRYDEAARAADTADRRRPGIPVFTRYAYVRELRGDVAGAREILERALGAATGRGDIAYVAAQLGQLAWNQGDYSGALRQYARALAADDSYLPALEGRARAQAASGDRAAAVRNLERIVSRAPLPGPLTALGELYEEHGELAKAREQYALVDAWTALARANGVDADLDTALAADHGDAAAALRAARAEWKRRQTVHTADALAWALHVNGRDAEALPYARRATATGYRNALFLYHRGMVEHGAGHPAEGRALLTEALGLNPGFSPLGARAARTVLEEAR
ncbi:hypothetical protein [Streptomyces sp. MUM 2J]|uniref:tetratricopeptide repeat protein n=1 Tax=Streptomyces sp. MUM 2J TaxID=2791987 RepID=UPI001F04A893|nr:hypothetical protein [Streptomyces sp. MUM 2J]